MTEMITVIEVEPLEGLRIRAIFSDGAIKEIDLSELIGKGGVFAPIRDRREVFEQVKVNPESQPSRNSYSTHSLRSAPVLS